jgi:hypothetical protein
MKSISAKDRMTPEVKAKISAALKKKWASGTRKKNPEGTGAKISAKIKIAHKAGRMHVFNAEDAAKGLAARKYENVLAANIKIGLQKRGVPNPPGISAASPDHWKAKYWTLIAPNKEVIHGRNLNDLIRKNAHLFNPEDLNWHKSRCRASSGLRFLFEVNSKGERKAHFWKGWTIGDTWDGGADAKGEAA